MYSCLVNKNLLSTVDVNHIYHLCYGLLSDKKCMEDLALSEFFVVNKSVKYENCNKMFEISKVVIIRISIYLQKISIFALFFLLLYGINKTRIGTDS